MQSIACSLSLLLSIAFVAFAQDFGSFFDNPQNIRDVIREVRSEMDKAKEMMRRLDEAPMDYNNMSPGEVFRRFFKRTSRGAREIADSRKMMERMVELIDERREWRGRPGSGIPSEVMDELVEASLCNVAAPRCNPGDEFRSINGTCNDLNDPLEGSAFNPFRRLLPSAYEDGIGQPVGFLQAFNLGNPRPFAAPRPSARLISQQVIRDLNIPQNDATLMLMQWGQFIDHDFAYLIEASVLEPEEEECEGCDPIGECIPIQVRDDDPDFGINTPNRANCIRFERAAAVCRPQIPGIFNPREQLNQITSWLDASMVYGSLDEEQPLLRKFTDGELLETMIPVNGIPARFMPIDPAPRMPCLPPRPCFRGGDLRANEQQGLAAMHTIWVRYHNNLARKLAKLNPTWDDERLFQETRKIVYATVEAITFNAYLPRMMGQQAFDRFIGPYTRYDPRQDGDLINAFGAAAYRIGHSQVQPLLLRLNADGSSIPEGPLNMELAFFNPDELVRGGGPEPLLRGLLKAESRKIDEFVTRILTTRLFAQSNPERIGTDLVSLNINRGRDHGIPSYRVFRNFCTNQLGLRGVVNADVRGRFLKLYGSEDDVDLWPAGLAEAPVPGGLLGPTFTCIWALTFKAMREGDRFWYENPGVFTPEQLSEIREKATLSSVICNASPDIGRVPPDAFSATEAPVGCDLIPQIDLQKWSETPEKRCWIKVQTDGPASRRSVVRSLYRYTADAYSWKKGEEETTEPAGVSLQAACVEFQCPTSEAPVTVAVQAYSPTVTYTRSIPSENLPPNKNSGNIYKANLPVRFGPAFGVYESEEECRSGGFALSTGGQMNALSGIGVKFTSS